MASEDQKSNRSDTQHPFSIYPTILAFAMSVIVYTRNNIGFRLLDGPSLIGPIFIHAGLGYFTFHNALLPPQQRIGGFAMMAYATGMFVFGVHHRLRGWRMTFREQNPVHTKSLGVCGFAPLCRCLRLRPQSAGVIEFFLVMSLGVYFSQTLGWWFLGWWLIIASVCVLLIDAMAMSAMRESMLDMRDSRAELQIQLQQEAGEVNAVRGHTTRRTRKDTRQSTVATLAPELEKSSRPRRFRRG